MHDSSITGEAAVGKSSLVLRFVQNDFNENTSPTIGAAFLTQSEYGGPVERKSRNGGHGQTDGLPE